MSATLISPDGTDSLYTWEGSRDDEGYRTYKVKHLVRTGDIDDGPEIVMRTPGLPMIGSFWDYGNDVDVWAFCTPQMVIRPHQVKRGDPHNYWDVENIFSTKPRNRCQDEGIEDPLMEPDRISGTFVKSLIEASYDKNGARIQSSSHEQLRGPAVEFDSQRPAVRIEQNVLDLGLAVFTNMMNRLNSAPMWGLPARCIKLSNASWERKVFATCSYYYTRTFEFDIDYTTTDKDGNIIGFDREAFDEGSKVLNGHWNETTGVWTLDNIGGGAPDKTNPSHFKAIPDRAGNPLKTLLLDGNGEPLTDIANPVIVDIAYYHEANFFTLGIPATL